MDPGRRPEVGPAEPVLPEPAAPVPPVCRPDPDLDRPAVPTQVPADHHMVAWPRVWREGLGYHVRICRHGLGHPDPEDVLGLQAAGGVPARHRCDGCCVAPVRDRG